MEIRVVALAIALTLASATALADFTGRVVKIVDGDTLDVLVDKTEVRVRLDSIDAPDRGQPFYKRSRASLAELCAGKHARVAERGRDRYGRAIGVVSCTGIDANAEQVRRGLAWVFVKYATPGSPLYELESAARSVGAGLWVDPRPVAPWEWRARPRATGTRTP